MPVSFVPALGDAVHIRLPPWYSCVGTQTVHLQFTAFLDDEEFQNFENGMKVQVWSNFASDGRRNGHEGWGAMDFELDPQGSLSFGPLSADGSREDGAQKSEFRHRLSLNFSVPFSASGNELSFTYRLLFPTGEERWLGSYGQNGTVYVDVSSAPDESGFTLEKEGWALTNSGSSSLWQWHGDAEEDPCVAKILCPENWSIWCIGKEGNSFVPSSALDGSSNARPAHANVSLLFLVPRVRPNSILRPKTLALHTSSDITLKIVSSSGGSNAHGIFSIFASGSGSIFLEMYERADTLLNPGQRDTRIKQISSSSDRHAIWARSQTEIHPVHGVNIPLLPGSKLPTTVYVESAALAALLGPTAVRFALFAPFDLGVHFVDLSSDKQVQETGSVPFSVPPAGEQFILSPFYSIPNGETEERTTSRLKNVQVSILSRHSSHVIESSVDEFLPTPPPSPHLRPIVRLSPTCAHSDTSISDMGMPSRRDTPSPRPDESIADMNSKVQNSSGVEATEGEETPAGDELRDMDTELEEEENAFGRERMTRSSRSESSSSLTVPTRTELRRPSSVSSLVGSANRDEGRFTLAITLVKSLIKAFALWLSMLIHSVFRSGHSEVMARQADPASRPQSPMPEAHDSTRDDDDTLEVEISSPAINERTPLLSRSSPLESPVKPQQNDAGTPVQVDQKVQKQSIVTEAETTSLSMVSQKKTFLVVDLLDSGAAAYHSLLIRESVQDSGNLSSDEIIEQLDIEFNGQPVRVSDVKTLDHGVILVKFGEKMPGKLRLSLRG